MSEEKLLFTVGAKDTSASVISKVNKNLKYLEQQYKATSNGSKDFEKTSEGMKAKLDLLSGKFEQTKIKLDAYNKKIDECKTKVIEQSEKMEKLKKSFNLEEAVSKSEAKIKSYQEKIDKATASMEKEKTKLDELKASQGNNAEAIAKSEAKIATYQQRIDKATASMEKEKAAMDKVKQGGVEQTAEFQKAESQMNKYSDQLTKAEQNAKLTDTQLKNLSADIAKTNAELGKGSIETYTSKLEKATQGIEDVGSKVSNAGSKITGYGQDLTVLSAGVTAVGVAGVKAYKDVKVGMDNVIKATGATGDSAKELEETYHDIGRNSAAEWGSIGSVLGEINTRFGYTGESAEKCSLQFLKFAKVNNTDATNAVKLVSRAMGDAGISADHYGEVLDMLTKAAQASGIGVDKLAENLTKFGAPMRNLGFDMKDSIALFATWEKAGVNTEVAFSGMKKAISTWGKTGKDATKEFSKTVQEIKNAKTPADATAKAIAAFGQKAGPDLADAIQGGRFNVDEMTQALNNCGGAVDDTAGQLADGTEEATKRLHEGQIALSDLGKTIISESVPFLKDMTEGVKTLSKWYNGLDDSTKQTIVRLGGFAAVCGPIVLGLGSVVNATGKTISAFGSIFGLAGKAATKFGIFGTAAKTAGAAAETAGTATKAAGAAAEVASVGIETATAAEGAAATGATGLAGTLATLGPAIAIVGAAAIAAGVAFYGASENDKLLNSTMLDSTDNMSGMEQVMAALTGTQRYSNEELENMGIKYKEFSDAIAPNTQSSLEDIAGKFRDVQTTVNEMDFSQSISDDDIAGLKSKTDDLVNTVRGSLDGLNSDIYNKTEQAFMDNDGVIDAEEQKILDKINTGGQQINDKVTSISNDINQIISSGQIKTEEGRQQYINDMQQLEDMLGDRLLASEQANQQDIDAFRDQADSLDLQKASDLMTEKANIRSQDIDDIKSKYDEQIAAAQQAYDVADGTDKQYWQDRLDKLNEQKDKELDSENTKYNAWLDMINEKYPELADQINQYDGSILSEKDQKCQEVLDTLNNTYEGIDQITESGTYTLRDKYTNTWDTITVKTDDATGQIIGIYDNYNGSIGGYTQSICDDMRSQGEQANITASDVSASFGMMAGATVDADGQIVGANGNVIGSLQNVKQNADGTRSGIINLNGTPVRIQCDNNGAIVGMDNVINKANAVPSHKEITITTVFKQIGQAVSGAWDWVKGHFAEGTDNAPAGLATVAEEGPELIFNKARNKAVLATNMSLFKMSGGEQVIPADLTKQMLSKNINGGFFNADSMQSQQLINNTSNYNTVTNNNGSNIDYSILGNVLVSSFAKALNSANFPQSGGGITLDEVAGHTGNNFARMKRRIR